MYPEIEYKVKDFKSLKAIRDPYYNEYIEEHPIGLSMGQIIIKFRDDFSFYKNRQRFEEEIEEDYEPFQVYKVFHLDDNLWGEGDYRLLSTTPGCKYRLLTMTQGNKHRIIEENVITYDLSDVRVREFSNDFKYFDDTREECSFYKGPHRMRMKVAPLRWTALKAIHFLSVKQKYSLFEKTIQFYDNKIIERSFEPILPKSLLTDLIGLEETCFLHNYEYRSYKNQKLISKLCHSQPCGEKCKLVTCKIAPQIPYAHNLQISRIWNDKVASYMLIPDSPVSRVLILHNLPIDRLYTYSQVSSFVGQFYQEILAEFEKDLSNNKYRGNYGLLGNRDYCICLVRKWYCVAIELTDIFRKNPNISLLAVLPKMSAEGAYEAKQRITQGINLEKLLEKLGEMWIQ